MKTSSAFTSAAYIQTHFILDLFMEANNMNPDQTDAKREWKQVATGEKRV